MENAFVLPSTGQNIIFHHVKAGDTLSSIINEYHAGSKQSMAILIKQVQIDNPNIQNPDRIQIGQLVAIRTIVPLMCMGGIEQTQISEVKKLWSFLDIETQDNMKKSSGVYNKLSLGLTSAGVGLFTLKHTLETNMSALNGIPDAYAKYKNKEITKYQFDKLRKAKLNSYADNIGPAIKKIIYGESEVKEAFKLVRGRSLDATKPMVHHMDKLKKIGKYAGKGSTILVGVGLAASCFEIIEAKTLPEKNEIAVKAIASTTVGLVAGVAINIFLITTPAGWVVALGWGLISAGLAMGAAEKAASVYKSHFVDTNVVDALGISYVCN